MYFPDKTQIGTSGKTYNHKCQHFHETTSDFMLPNVPFIKKIKGKTNIKDMMVEYYSRCNPMPIPTMGIAYTKLNWYFVPFRILWNAYEAYKSRSIFYYNNAANQITMKPRISMSGVMAILYNPANGFTTSENYNASRKYDFIYDDNGTLKGCTFTKAGIQWYTIWCQLGYQVSNLDWKSTTLYVNALPLLAFCKVIADCYTPKAFADYEQNYIKLYALLNSPMINTVLTQGELLYLFNWFTVVCYEDDYFNSAWINPTGPNDGYTQIGQLPVFFQDGNNQLTFEYVSDAGNTAHVTFNNNNITNEHLELLKAYDKYLKKSQIVGTKYWDRLLAHYGIETDKALLKVPELIKSDKIYYKFNEIYSTTQNASGNSGAELGAYAGNGETFTDGGANTQSFDYYAEEDGYLILIATNEPEIAYGNGYDRDVLDYEVLDDWAEEFDGNMIEAISPLEIYSGYDAPDGGWYTGRPWGFVNKYASQKITMSKCTGLMNCNSKKAEMARWNFMRWYNVDDFPPITSGQAPLKVQNSVFNCLGYGEGNTDLNSQGSQYSRIFYQEETPNFNMYFRFSFNMKNSMKPYFYEDNLIDDDDKAIKVDAV